MKFLERSLTFIHHRIYYKKKKIFVLEKLLILEYQFKISSRISFKLSIESNLTRNCFYCSLFFFPIPLFIIVEK